MEALSDDLKDISDVEKEEVIVNANRHGRLFASMEKLVSIHLRLRTRLSTVVCVVHTLRDPGQAEALAKTEEKIRELLS